LLVVHNLDSAQVVSTGQKCALSFCEGITELLLWWDLIESCEWHAISAQFLCCAQSAIQTFLPVDKMSEGGLLVTEIGQCHCSCCFVLAIWDMHKKHFQHLSLIEYIWDTNGSSLSILEKARYYLLQDVSGSGWLNLEHPKAASSDNITITMGSVMKV
jgi:hypothetical protein